MTSRAAFVSASALSLLSSTAFAQNWVQVGPTPPEYSMYYDNASVYREGTLGFLMSLVNYAYAKTDPNVVGGSRSFSSQTFVTAFDCSTFEIAGNGDFTFYSEQWAGGELVLRSGGVDTTRRPINSGTANEAMYRAACG